MRVASFLLMMGLLGPKSAFAIFGTELGPLLQLVAGQVQEIEKLTQTVGFARDQVQMLRSLNDGIDRTVSQIQTIQQIVERAQGLDPTSVRSLADLNELLYRAKGTKAAIEDLLGLKVQIANQAIARSALQSDTAYRMGQEMVVTGSQLASDSQSASPGRASQITAAAESAQVLSQGVQLQTLAHVAELQALSLEFQKTQVEKELQNEQLRRAHVELQLAKVPRRARP